MQSVFDLIEKIGLFALVVIAVCVGLMLLVSLLDRHPRRKSTEEQDKPRA